MKPLNDSTDRGRAIDPDDPFNEQLAAQAGAPRPKDYRAIEFWGRRRLSLASYTCAEQHRAAAANAPLNSIFYNGQRWVTLDELKDSEAIEEARQGGLI